jgi:tRNA(fMet)-specific endonuclease VapC
MILLDSDHATILKYRKGDRYHRLIQRMEASPEPLGTTIITVEEQMRGWLATVARERKVERQINPYRELSMLFDFFSLFRTELFDSEAAIVYKTLGKVNIGQIDRKIASIAISNDALLLTANKKDFEQVPGLRFEYWMDL